MNRVVAVLALSILILAGCESKITQANFDKITMGMTLSQVEKIMGGKGDNQTSSGTSIGGAGLMENSKDDGRRVYVWKEKNKSITVVVKNDKVIEKVPAGL